MLDFFRNTLAPWQWGLIAIVPPAIIALYFLKLKRLPLEVPSTYLWRKSIEDLHVNSFWQRLRKNLLLFLQLLLVGLAMLALLRPGWMGTELEGQRFIFLVDNSASMSATDVENAENRLDAAKEQVRNLIDQMGSGMTAMIISFADSPQVVQEFTDNRRLLRERLDSIKPTFRTTDLKGALELADGLANPNRIIVEESGLEVDVAEPQEATLFIFSDGRFEDVKNFSLGHLDAKYIPIGSMDAQNLAITTLATRRNETRPAERQAFVQVANLTGEAQKAVVELSLDGEFLDAQSVDLAANATGGAVFPLADAPPGALVAKLTQGSSDGTFRDVLAIDDTAYAPLNSVEPGRVLVVTPANAALEVALKTDRAKRLASIEFATPGFLETDEYRKAADAGTYDLVIYDQCAPENMPRGDSLFVGRLPPLSAWHSTVAAENGEPTAAEPTFLSVPQIIDWNRAHPLMASVELGNVRLADSILVPVPPGGDVLVDSTGGPIAVVAPRESYQDVILGYEIIGRNDAGEILPNTDWPRKHSFPTFWLNALEYLAGQMEDTLASVQPGRPIELRVPGNPREITIVGPDKQARTIKRGSQDLFQFQDTSQPGIYEVRVGDAVLRRFGVNLFDRDESNVQLKPSNLAEGPAVASLEIGNIDVQAAAGAAPARKELWKVLLLAALVILILEWYIYNRRVYI